MQLVHWFWIMTGMLLFILLSAFYYATTLYARDKFMVVITRFWLTVDVFLIALIGIFGGAKLNAYSHSVSSIFMWLNDVIVAPMYSESIAPVLSAFGMEAWLHSWWPGNLTLMLAQRAENLTAFCVQLLVLLLMGQLFFSVWMIGKAFLVWLGRCLEPKSKKEEAKEIINPSRRKVIGASILVPAVATGMSLYGVLGGKNETIVRELALPTKGLPKSLYGFRIVQLSDVHLGMFYSLDEFRELLKRTTTLKADALVLTGDIFDDKSVNDEAIRLVNEFVSYFPKGIFFCYGNHEHIRGVAKIEAALKNTRIKVLKNTNTLVADAERPLYFAGVDYPMARPAFDMLAVSYLDEAMRTVPKNAVTVLLAHHPDFIDYAAERGISVVLAGHTHGGQIGLFGKAIVPNTFSYIRGMYKVNHTTGYVHSGNGSWFPFRLGCPPEIASFVLVEEG